MHHLLPRCVLDVLFLFCQLSQVLKITAGMARAASSLSCLPLRTSVSTYALPQSARWR